MINRIWIKLTILLTLVICISCNNKVELKNENNSYLMKPKNSNVEVDLRLDENNQITSFALRDDNQNFSMMFNLLEDGNCSLKLNTNIFEETLNTNISEVADKYINQYLVINNKIYILQDIDNDGRIISQINNK